MTEPDILEIVARFAQRLPHFSDGRIDYSGAREAAVLNAAVCCRGELLLLKRSTTVRAYRGSWNVVGGYLDEAKPLHEKVYEELREELAIAPEQIAAVLYGEPLVLHDAAQEMTWHVYPVRVDCNEKPPIVLDHEHTEYRWITPAELSNFPTVSGLASVLSRVL